MSLDPNDYLPDDQSPPPATPPGPEGVNPARFTLPGGLMLATGVINLLLALMSGFTGYMMYAMPREQFEETINKQLKDDPSKKKQFDDAGIGVDELRNIYGYGLGGGGVLWLLCSILAIVGGVCMMARKARGLAILGSIVTVLPCITSPCCLLGMPVGIWALAVLISSDARAAFR